MEFENYEKFKCVKCGYEFDAQTWFNTQKTRTVKTDIQRETTMVESIVFYKHITTKRKQTGCPMCHASVSKRA